MKNQWTTIWNEIIKVWINRHRDYLGDITHSPVGLIVLEAIINNIYRRFEGGNGQTTTDISIYVILYLQNDENSPFIGFVSQNLYVCVFQGQNNLLKLYIYIKSSLVCFIFGKHLILNFCVVIVDEHS